MLASTWELRSLSMTSPRWHWLQSSCISSMPPYGRWPLLWWSWAGLVCQLLHLYPLASSLNLFQASAHGTQWPHSGCIQASLLSLAVLAGAWAELRTRLCLQVPGVCDGNLPAVPALQTHTRASWRNPTPRPLLAPLFATVLPATQDDFSPRGAVLGEARGVWDLGEGQAPFDQPLSPVICRCWSWR